jgi:two-component system sensor histidine kinase PilS (NtrC family)
VEYQTEQGGKLKLGYSLARLYDPEDKSPIGTLIVFQDLTHIIELEEKLRLNEKLAAVGKLAAGIAHEIRNPLASISGCAQLLSGNQDLDEEDKKMLQIIQSESQRLDGLITDFLEYVRPPQPKLENVDLKALIERLEQSFSHNSKWKALNCTLVSQLPEKGFNILGDSNKITQVLMNFVLNSGQAGAKEVKLELSSNGKLQIGDDGAGIAKNIQNRIFEPFFTTKTSTSGTGLGLYLSKMIAQRQNSELSFTNLMDEAGHYGAAFCIKIPKAINSSKAAA